MSKFDKTAKLLGKIAEEAGDVIAPAAKKSNLKFPGGMSKEEYLAWKQKNKIMDRQAAAGIKPGEIQLKPKDVPMQEGPSTLTGSNKLHNPEMSGIVNYKKANAMMPMAAAEGLYKDLKGSALGDAATYWNKVKQMLAGKAAQQMDLTGGKDPQFQQIATDVLATGLDPVNLIPGVGGMAAGAAEMLTNEDEEEPKKKKGQLP